MAQQLNPSPIERIPPEILCKIFVTLRDISSEKDNAAELALAEQDMVTICTVSKQWRATALDTSYLWSRAVYLQSTAEPTGASEYFKHSLLDRSEPTGASEYFKKSFLRSGQQKLHVVIHVDPLCKRALAPIMRLVMPHIHRVESLRVSNIIPATLQTTSPNVLFLDDPMNHLDKSFPWSGVPTATLKHLTISNVALSPLEMHLFLRHCRQLVYLKITQVLKRGWAPAMDATDAYLDSCLPLQLLSLREAIWDGVLLAELTGAHGISMPQVSNLAIHINGAIRLMSLPSLPTTLKELTLKGPFLDTDVLDMFALKDAERDLPLETGGCKLQSLRLHGCEAGPRLLSSLSTGPVLPFLTRLEVLYGCLADDDVFRFLDAYDNVSNGRMNNLLCEAHIHYCPHTTTKLFEAFKERGRGSWLRRPPPEQPAVDFVIYHDLQGVHP